MARAEITTPEALENERLTDAALSGDRGEALLETGVTAYLPTLITAPEERLVEDDRVARGQELGNTAVAQNDAMKKLAGWAALLAAPTLITSWYGMNFHHMPELSGRYSYFILIGIVAVVCIGLYRYLRKVQWL